MPEIGINLQIENLIILDHTYLHCCVCVLSVCEQHSSPNQRKSRKAFLNIDHWDMYIFSGIFFLSIGK